MFLLLRVLDLSFKELLVHLHLSWGNVFVGDFSPHRSRDFRFLFFFPAPIDSHLQERTQSLPLFPSIGLLCESPNQPGPRHSWTAPAVFFMLSALSESFRHSFVARARLAFHGTVNSYISMPFSTSVPPSSDADESSGSYKRLVPSFLMESYDFCGDFYHELPSLELLRMETPPFPQVVSERFFFFFFFFLHEICNSSSKRPPFSLRRWTFLSSEIINDAPFPPFEASRSFSRICPGKRLFSFLLDRPDSVLPLY